MTSSDLPRVSATGNGIHLNYFEDPKVFAERHALYPQGCHVLDDGNDIQGYIVSHPWHFGKPPALNTFLQSLPRPADTYYIHDITLIPAARGRGSASKIVEKLVEQARKEGFPNMSLITVNNTKEFWRRHGFDVFEDPALTAKLQSYDNEARFMVRNLKS